MRIAMAVEYFWPYDLGGSEWSTYYLAKKLQAAGHEIIIITPNYEIKNPKVRDKFKVIRFPFLKKIKNKKPLTPFWHTNFLWMLTTCYYLAKICREEKIEILHLQGKYYSPAGFFVKLVLNIPVILTARDYQLICNYGFCLWNKKKQCDLKEYFEKDFKKYFGMYVIQKNVASYLSNFIFAIRGRIIRNIYKYFASKLDQIVCISKFQGEIYKNNGFKKVSVIYNPMEFKLNHSNVQNKIIYAGRLTPGKGIELLISAFEKVVNNFPEIKLEIYGEGILKNYLKTSISNNIKKNIIMCGYINHQDLLENFSSALVTVMPSVWPEPFGRIALESLSQGTPAVVTRVGGLPEIVENGKTGYVCSPTTKDISKNIQKAITNNKILRKNIKNAQSALKQKFEIDNANQYIELYRRLI